MINKNKSESVEASNTPVLGLLDTTTVPFDIDFIECYVSLTEVMVVAYSKLTQDGLYSDEYLQSVIQLDDKIKVSFFATSKNGGIR